jgi:hypothetical protein
MLAETLSRVRPAIVMAGVANVWLVVSCATSRSAESVSIRLQPDVVALRREPDAVALDLHAQIRNRSAQELYVAPSLCGVELQRQLEGAWQTVWIPACAPVAYPPQRVAAGDSVSSSFTARAFTNDHTFPKYDPRMGPGRYRVVMRLGFRTNSTGSIDQLPVDARASEPFVVN